MKKLIILSIFILSSFGFAQAQILPELEKVKAIKLLESNRDDVRRIFANIQHVYDDARHRDTFFTDNSEIEVYYSTGLCNENSVEWDLNISEWIVAGIEVNPKNPIALKTLKSNTIKYTKEKMYKNSADRFLYHDKDTGIVFKVERNIIQSIFFNPPKKYYSLLCDKDQAKILLSTKNLFTMPLKDRIINIDSNDPAYTETLILSVAEIVATCLSPNAAQNESCSSGNKLIAVFAVGKDSEGDALTYDYAVSGGKIIGTGSKVVWDMSGVKPGTYTITAAVDDGCGFCGKSMTKTVVVKECPNCGQN